MKRGFFSIDVLPRRAPPVTLPMALAPAIPAGALFTPIVCECPRCGQQFSAVEHELLADAERPGPECPTCVREQGPQTICCAGPAREMQGLPGGGATFLHDTQG